MITGRMSNRKLYIIGNGFDLHHDLKTSYAAFCRHVKENDKELYEFLESYVDVDLDKDGLWKNFEKDLGTFDHVGFYSDYDYTEPSNDNFKLSDMFGVEDELTAKSEMMIEKMCQALYDWLDEIVYLDKGYKALPLDTYARYLTFNYTPTLNLLYSIPDENILHIHHSVATHGSDLVFGHGSIIEEVRLLDDKGNGNYPSSSYSNAESASKMLLAHFYKDTKNIIRKNVKFFDNLWDIDEIIVLGHSLNDIDLSYFGYIMKIVGNDISWIVSYYSDDECEGMNDRLKSVGAIGKITFIKMESLT